MSTKPKKFDILSTQKTGNYRSDAPPIQIMTLKIKISFLKSPFFDNENQFNNQGPDLYAFIAFIGFIGPDNIHYMC